MRQLVLITGSACCLCDTAEGLIRKVQADVPFELTIRDVEDDPALKEAYRHRIPVVMIDGEVVLEGKVSEFWLRKALAGEPITRFKLL